MKRRDKRKEVAVILCIVAILIIILMLVLFLPKKDNNTVDNSNQNNNNDENSQVENNNSIGDTSNIINMENTENVSIEDNKKVNTSSKFKEEKVYNNIVLKDVSLYTDANTRITTFTATVENRSNERFNGENLQITFLNNNNEPINSIEIYIDGLDAGSSNSISAFSGDDVANAYDYQVSKME